MQIRVVCYEHTAASIMQKQQQQYRNLQLSLIRALSLLYFVIVAAVLVARSDFAINELAVMTTHCRVS
jgi:predicted nucleic acid-binding Zn ribbon protein